jgi:hypothetical protein
LRSSCFVGSSYNTFVAVGFSTDNDNWKKSYVQSLLDKLELTNESHRVQSARSLLYLMQGMFYHCKTFEEQQRNCRSFCFIVYENGGFVQLVQLLLHEANNVEAARNAMAKTSISVVDNVNLRLCLSLLYHLVESMRQEPPDMEPQEVELRDVFLADLAQPVTDKDCLAAILFDLVLKFCSGSMPHYPIKKLLLLLWKTVLLSLGGFAQLQAMKENARKEAGLPPACSYLYPVRKSTVRCRNSIQTNDDSEFKDTEQLLDDVSSDITSDISSDMDSDTISEVSLDSISDVSTDIVEEANDDVAMVKMKAGDNSPPPLAGDVSSGGRRVRLESGTFEELRQAKAKGDPPGPPPKVRSV